MTNSPTDFGAFAAALAARLPGTWTSHYHQHTVYTQQFALSNQVWDLGHVHWAISEFVLRHDAELNGPHGQRLYVIERPLKPGQFLVAPLQPSTTISYFDDVDEPNGIAVPGDPPRAAAAVTRRLLPRYQLALTAVRSNNATARTRHPASDTRTTPTVADGRPAGIAPRHTPAGR
ncbi:hypothetical protein [Streptomyces sp. IB2014 016-6]|uniref:hypothetical protein n=1 Tax=Streptomyces sp. IB2014 016-6 TaxID=2517818 RepID=UPI0011C85164|nr:hypothetical protein [Streptomyces sp. IB2014 016-6]TXL84189.1 hypothetical protein EW053_35115 [Streptomyces sp. IB2014 016-6]